MDRIGQEKSRAYLSRYQVSIKKRFEGALIIFSHLSRWPQQPSLWCKTNNLINCWLGVCVISINVQLSSLHFIPNSHIVMCFQGKLCTLLCSLLVCRDEKWAPVHIFIPRWCNINNETGNLCKESHLVSSTLMQWPKVLKCNYFLETLILEYLLFGHIMVAELSKLLLASFSFCH